MGDAPERIFVTWPTPNGTGLAFTCQARPPAFRTEYTRSDLTTTDAQEMEHQKVKALVEAAKPYISPVQNADYGRQLRQHEALCAALRELEAGNG